MECILFGFGMDIKEYPVMEVFLYLLIYSLILAMVGRIGFCNRIRNRYSVLIRYGSLSGWWYWVMIRVIATCLISVALLFGIGKSLLGDQMNVYTRTDWWLAIVLWMTGLSAIGIVQTFIIQLRNTYKIAFMLLMCFEVLSLYLPEFPGSWLMYERCALRAEDGFLIENVLVVQFFVIIMLGVWGYCLFKIRRNNESCN